MPRLTIVDLDQTLELARGESVGEALQRAGVELEEPCGGNGVCGQCRVWVLHEHAALPQTPHDTITSEQAEAGLRLACQLAPETDLTVRLYEDRLHATDAAQPEELDPFAGELATAAEVEREQDGSSWLRYHHPGEQPARLETWEQGWAPKGLAVDLGTTTLVVGLVCLRTGRLLATESAINPQSRFGHDVMTRISCGSSPEGLDQLAEVVHEALNRLVGRVCAVSGSDQLEVVDVVVGGNTTMLQLAARIDPAPLGRSPFTVGVKGGELYEAGRFGLQVNPAARLYLPPVAHAFFGSDVSAGLAVCDRFFDPRGARLFTDIGTNGELALGTSGSWVYSSAAAGPAFEGMGLSCGMRAVAGAVEAVAIEQGSLALCTIGAAPVRGLCGSGVIDLVACLLELGVLDRTGRMRRPADREGLSEWVASRLEEVDGKAAFRIAEGVLFTQKDVRQVQLAKGAIRAAIDLILEETGRSPESVEEVILAGAFGSSLRPESLEAIGLIPEGMAGRVSFAGNTSLRGCVRLLRDAEQRRLIERSMEQMEHLSLAEQPEFMERFLCQMSFPDRPRR